MLNNFNIVPKPGLMYPFYLVEIMARGTKINGRVGKRKNRVFLWITLFIFFVGLSSALVYFLYTYIHNKVHSSDSIASLYDSWSERDYHSVYNISGNILSTAPLNNTARTFHGYSGFYLALSETDNTLSMAYLDDSLISLRIALKNAKEESIAQLKYMLGKAYFYKNRLANYHFYSDLVIKYLNESLEAGYEASDIFEYLGLSYAALGQTQNSINAFSSALSDRESDMLLLSIAEQYCENKQGNVAKQYLNKVIATSENEDFLKTSHILLGKIYTDEENYEEAEKEFQIILQKDENSADAHFSLGVLYEKQGDMAKARSEWRRCLKIQPNHSGAIQKISENK